MILAHPVSSSSPLEASTTSRKVVMPPAGGMLFGCQDRAFGRSRRAARLHTLPLLYIGTDGFLRSGIGQMKSSIVLADDQWHRVTLTMTFTDAGTRVESACMYIDGVFDQLVHSWPISGLPSYSVLGSGITEGYLCGASTPVYNCHTFHGMIDEFRLWGRALQSYEVSIVHLVRLFAMPHLQQSLVINKYFKEWHAQLTVAAKMMHGICMVQNSISCIFVQASVPKDDCVMSQCTASAIPSVSEFSPPNNHVCNSMCACFAAQVQQLAWQRVTTSHDMPYANGIIGSWSLTEGSGGVMHNHIRKQTFAENPNMSRTVKIIDGQLGAIPIPSAHHTYSSVSNLVDCIPEEARSSSGPAWTHSSAPVEGELIMEFVDSSDQPVW